MKQFRPQINMNRRPQMPMVNNVLSERHTIPLKVTRFFTDVNGQILSITDPLIVAAGLNVKWPVFLFGPFDQNGGYSIAQKICKPVIGDYLFTFVNGKGQTSASVIGFTGLNEIQGQLKAGDIVQVYTDNLQNPNYFVWMVLNNSYTGLGSIVQNLNTSQNDGRKGRLKVSGVKMYFANVNQLNETVNFTITDNLGTFRNDSIQPYLFRNPYDGHSNFVDMQTDFDLTQFLGVNTYLGVDADNVSFDFLIES
jgi:hypothetical protein